MNMLLGVVLGFVLIGSILTIIAAVVVITVKDSNDHFYKLQQSSYLKKISNNKGDVSENEKDEKELKITNSIEEEKRT